jgi:hypothetical protein
MYFAVLFAHNFTLRQINLQLLAVIPKFFRLLTFVKGGQDTTGPLFDTFIAAVDFI